MAVHDAQGQPTVSPAREYAEFFGPALFEPLADVTVRHAVPRLAESALDLACGTGIVTRRLAAAVGPTGRVVGLDISVAMLEEARGRPRPEGAEIEWRHGDAQATGLPD